MLFRSQRIIMAVLRRYSNDKGYTINVSTICTRQMETLNLLEPSEKPKTSVEKMQEDTKEDFGEETKFGTRRE